MAKSENSKTLLDFGNVSDEDIQEYFDSIFVAQQANAEVKSIFSVALKNKELFPNINLFSGSTYTDYIDRWLKGYIYADSNPPHLRVASPKSSCSDPAIKSVVKIATNLSDEDAERQESHHNLFMSAENIQGQLLEEYISVVVAEHGWLWCKGNTMHAIDFCTRDGKYLLQIKNKSNSENSSSSHIRSGTSIEKWYRLGTQKVNGLAVPIYKWPNLNAIIQKASGNTCNMSEKEYISFIEKVVSNNSAIITDK